MNRANGPKLCRLPVDWRYCAEATARNLGFTAPLNKLPAEQWQKVLNSVEMKMQLKAAAIPDESRLSLAEEVVHSNG